MESEKARAGVTNALGRVVWCGHRMRLGWRAGLMVFRVDLVLFPRIGSSPNCPSVTVSGTLNCVGQAGPWVGRVQRSHVHGHV